MPVIPCFNGDPGSSVVGVMLFPNDREQARAYASGFLLWGHVDRGSSPIQQYGWARAASELDLSSLLGRGVREVSAEVIKQAWKEGEAVGYIVNKMDADIDRKGDAARWSEAINWFCEHPAGKTIDKVTAKRYLANKMRVQHLWGALCAMEWHLKAHGKHSPLRSLLMISEMLLKRLIEHSIRRGQTNFARIEKGRHFHIDADHWRADADWPPLLELERFQSHPPETNGTATEQRG